MAKAKVIHSDDAVLIAFNGDKAHPEPSTGVIKSPGGHVEVSRCSDGSYYAHIAVVDSANVVASRMDFQDATENKVQSVQDIPHGHLVNHIAIRISNKIPHPDLG